MVITFTFSLYLRSYPCAENRELSRRRNVATEVNIATYHTERKLKPLPKTPDPTENLLSLLCAVVRNWMSIILIEEGQKDMETEKRTGRIKYGKVGILKGVAFFVAPAVLIIPACPIDSLQRKGRKGLLNAIHCANWGLSFQSTESLVIPRKVPFFRSDFAASWNP
jgi:hypothetical protein